MEATLWLPVCTRITAGVQRGGVGWGGLHHTIGTELSEQKEGEYAAQVPTRPRECHSFHPNVPLKYEHAHTHTNPRTYCPIIPTPPPPRGFNDKGANTNLLTQGCYYQAVTQTLCKLMFPLLSNSRILETPKTSGGLWKSATTGQPVVCFLGRRFSTSRAPGGQIREAPRDLLSPPD